MPNIKIDVHAHFIPDLYREALEAAGQAQPDGIKGLPEWSEELALQAMDRLGVERSLLSISSPGVHFGDAAALARQVNEEGARLVRAHPGRFGFFASLPLPDVPAAEEELRYAFDELDADGIVLETHHGGMYLGDERLEPLYAEVARRDSVVFVHPTTAFHGEHLGLGYPRPMLEFMFETTRSITDLILSGVLDRHPRLNLIVPHAGAALPVLAGRIELLLPLLTAQLNRTIPSIRKALKRLHFDLAGAPVPELLDALLKVADPGRMHYGSDFPFTPLEPALGLADALAETPLLSSKARADMFRCNALELLQ
ncbi:amidohydrolase family protein [Nonomuraea sp. NPDC059023]|uniref:amidohydrolase family protein n=1 Tax=unclassified Nonomuraea TaxID=2593643 RepID=UPI0036BB3DC7